jgi:hypothetical protein
MISNNITDLIQSARDGELGVIDQILIGDLVVSALFGLDAPDTLSLTNRRIQSGADMATMAVEDRRTVSMDICLANPEISIDGALTTVATGDIGVLSETWRDKRDELRKMKNNREVVDIQTHDDLFESFVITGLYPIFDVDENWDAFIVSVIMEKVRLYGQNDEDSSIISQANQAVSGL